MFPFEVELYTASWIDDMGSGTNGEGMLISYDVSMHRHNGLGIN